MKRGAGTCGPRKLGAVTGPRAPPTQSPSSRSKAVPADAAGAPPPPDEFTSKGRGSAPGTVAGDSRGRKREASTFSDPSFAPRCSGTDRHPKERRCLAFWIDAGQRPTFDASEAPRILIPVGRLGRHDAAHQYTRKNVTVTCGGHTLQVWLNVTPGSIEGPQPILRQDEDGEWHVDGNDPGHQGGRDYEDFCAAANSTKVSPQMVRVVRRWPRTRARTRQRARRTASALVTGRGKVRRGHEAARGPVSTAREATINYYDALAPTDEELGEVAAPPLSQGATVSPSLAQHPSAAPQHNADPRTSGPAADGAKTLRAEARPYEPGKRVKVPSSTMGDPPAAGLAEARESSHHGPPERDAEDGSGKSARASACQGSDEEGSSQDPPSLLQPPKTSACGSEGRIAARILSPPGGELIELSTAALPPSEGPAGAPADDRRPASGTAGSVEHGPRELPEAAGAETSRLPGRKVSWHPDLVTNIQNVPRVSDSVKRLLHCTAEEISRWRRESSSCEDYAPYLLERARSCAPMQGVPEGRAARQHLGPLASPPPTAALPSSTARTNAGPGLATGQSVTSDAGAGERGSPTPPAATLPECVKRDSELLKKLGWRKFVLQRRTKGDFACLDDVAHPAQRLLKFYKSRGAPARFKSEPWSAERVDKALQRGAHRSCMEHLEFLHEEFEDMVAKAQWIVLPASEVRHLPGLRISPPGVVPQRDRRPRWIVDYTWSEVNQETLPLAAVEAMQFGHALDRLLREILLADPAHGPVQMMKVDLSDGFYRVNLNIDDIPKLGVAFPTKPGEEQLVAFPLVLPMGWKNSPPIFSTVTETIADIANQHIQAPTSPRPHHLDEAAAAVDAPNPWGENEQSSEAVRGYATQGSPECEDTRRG